MRGILRDVKDGSYAVPENPNFSIRVNDPQGRLLSVEEVKLSKFGTFDATLALPSQAAIGTYAMTAVNGQSLSFQGTFEVREFKLEKIKLAMDFPRASGSAAKRSRPRSRRNTTGASRSQGACCASRCPTAASNASPPMRTARRLSRSTPPRWLPEASSLSMHPSMGRIFPSPSL